MNNIVSPAYRKVELLYGIVSRDTDHDVMSEEELAVAYVNGDNAAFDELLRRNEKTLMSYILFVVRNNDLAMDIFQDTFVKVILKLQSDEYKPTGKFNAWLTRIAHNVIMDHYRRLHGSQIVDVNEENDMSSIKGESMADEPIETYFINEQTLTEVKQLMYALPAVQREVVYMRFFQEMSFKEIAEATGVSINTSLGRMRYAVINLRRMVKEHDLELRLV